MKTIGLIGEDPNDTKSIERLLAKKYDSKKIKFIPLLKQIRGYQLDSTFKVARALKVEFEDKKCDFAIYIRDLDSHAGDQLKLKERNTWFKTLDASINKKGLLLLNIYELEGLILADIQTFNKIYKTNIKYPGDCSVQKDPKEFLQEKTRKCAKQYRESDCPSIFNYLDIETLINNCAYFKKFIIELNTKLK